MQKNHSLWYILVTLLAGVLGISLIIDLVWSTSADLAHHYALVVRYFDSWHPSPNDPSLGEMNIYPPASHIAAAMIGRLVGSPFLGLHLTALISLVALWAAHLSILYKAPNRAGSFTALVLALLVVLNHGSLRIHGAEISNAYHYSQLVGMALAYIAIAIAVRLDGRVHHYWRSLFLLLAMGIVASFHLLPALMLLGVLGGVLLLDVVVQEPGRRIRSVLAGAVVLTFGVALIVLHPSFTAMRLIAQHNGGMSLGILGPMWSLAVVSLIVLASLVPLLRAWRRDPVGHVMYKYVIVYGAALAGLCLLQMGLRYLGLGSDYAVKKYAYPLGTFLIVRLAIWIGASATARGVNRPRVALLGTSAVFQVVVFGVALFAVVLGCTRMRHELDTFTVVDLERQLLAVREAVLPPAPDGKFNAIMELKDMPDVVDYMFSIGLTGTSRAKFDYGDKLGFGPISGYGTVITSQGQPPFADAGHCALSRFETLVLLDAACLARLKPD